MSRLGFGASQLSPLDSSSFASETLSSLVSSGAPYTASVVYLLTTQPLARPKESISRSLLLLQKNVPWRYQWPILLFHAGIYDSVDSQSQFLDDIRDGRYSEQRNYKLIQRIEFVYFRHDLPVGIPAADDETEYEHVWGGWPGYHHMCSFFSYKIFKHPRIRDLTYYFRLDDDSFIHKPACFDPVEYMHANNMSFSFREADGDPYYVTEGMWSYVNDYARSHPDVDSRMPQQRLAMGGKPAVDALRYRRILPRVWGNFEIVKLSRFRTPDAMAFLNDLASDPHRFYRFRWGDAPLRKAMVYMFLNVTQETHSMCEIAYTHKEEIAIPNCECIPLPPRLHE
ncbi:glycolipid 2-alpha-mannosyltransferase-domain-containing protein [Mycena olivaceomarginata]|nr:glycolipid 2-alpha-mannosyltransferase-domain-containing protein [Mycena olivaceomarginata]